MGSPLNKTGSLINITGWGSPPKTNLYLRFKLKFEGGIRIGPVVDQKGFRRHLEGSLLNSSQIFSSAAQLRTTKGPQTNQGVLNDFGQASHNLGPHINQDPTLQVNVDP